jgi:4-amino-4-deoxy-L-arabinose transferase-like glycosyltransferase
MRKVLVGATLGVVLTVTAALYLTRLSEVPAHLMHDEVNFSLQAHAIATTARDTNGRFLPVYFSETGFEAGRDPLMIYWTALFLTVQPLSESAVRGPTAFLAVLTVALMFVFGRRMFGSNWLAIIAAAFLALTPGYFINARLALSITYAIPVLVLWLYCMQRAIEGNTRWALGAGASLGVGLYAYLASMVVMPMLLLFSIAALWREGRQKEMRWLIGGFALLLVPLAGWLVFHPDRFSNLLTSYRLEGVPSADSLRDRITAFWMFFNPDYLFISGDGRVTNSTRQAGLFPLAFAVLLPVGLYRLVSSRRSIGVLIAAGFVIAPLATALSGRLDINRVLCAIPFGVIAAAVGAEYLLGKARGLTIAGGLLVLVVALQFAVFYRHYAGPYRISSAVWFGGDNRSAVNDALDRVIATSPRVYLNGRTPIERYWRFYAAVRGRDDLADSPRYYDPVRPDVVDAEPGSLVVCELLHSTCPIAASDPHWTLVASGTQPDGSVAHQVYLRRR